MAKPHWSKRLIRKTFLHFKMGGRTVLKKFLLIYVAQQNEMSTSLQILRVEFRLGQSCQKNSLTLSQIVLLYIKFLFEETENP